MAGKEEAHLCLDIWWEPEDGVRCIQRYAQKGEEPGLTSIHPIIWQSLSQGHWQSSSCQQRCKNAKLDRAGPTRGAACPCGMWVQYYEVCSTVVCGCNTMTTVRRDSRLSKERG